MRLRQDVLAVLSACRCEGAAVYLPPRQLDRKLYEAVNKALEALGGKWDRKAKAHLFAADPEKELDRAILTGEVTRPQDFGFFPTPPELAARVAELADVSDDHVVLEPSAGEGALLDACFASCPAADLHAVELLPQNVERLKAKGYPSVTAADFLSLPPTPTYDRVVMNPPFGKQADVDHVRHAWQFVKPGGRLVAIMAAGVSFRENRKTAEFRTLIDEYGYLEENPDGAFLASGTGVRTVTVVLDKAA